MRNHVISTNQFLKGNLLRDIFQLADKFYREQKKGIIYKKLNGKILASVFYEPSTRTRFSFEAAMLRLGGGVISTESAGHFSSAIKGESLEDSIRVIGGYADAIVLRHHEVGAAQRAAKVSSVPIINAGDGAGEHPTQALLDLYTIKKELGRMHNFRIALVGDLLYGRTIHSLINLLSTCRKIKVFAVSPRELRLPEKYRKFLRNQKIEYFETDSLNKVLSQTDVLYVTRIQKERFSSKKLYERAKKSYVIDPDALKKLPKKAIIMAPLPRVKKISPQVDSDPRAAYFRQAKNGLFIRMALLQYILK